MIKTVSYKFSSADEPWASRINEPFFRLYAFATDLFETTESNPQRSAFNRITNGQWDANDVDILAIYGHEVAKRAEEKYGPGPLMDAPWRDEILQAAASLRSVMCDFKTWFESELQLISASEQGK